MPVPQRLSGTRQPCRTGFLIANPTDHCCDRKDKQQTEQHDACQRGREGHAHCRKPRRRCGARNVLDASRSRCEQFSIVIGKHHSQTTAGRYRDQNVVQPRRCVINTGQRIVEHADQQENSRNTGRYFRKDTQCAPSIGMMLYLKKENSVPEMPEQR